MLYPPVSSELNTVADVLEHYPHRRVLLLKVMEDIMRNFSPFSKASRELMFAYISDLNQCSLCYSHHKAVSVALGLDEAVFTQLKTDINSAKIDDELKPILRFVKKLTLNPDKITPEDAQQIFDAGWDKHAYFDSVCICAIVNCMNRFVTGVGIDADSSGMNKIMLTMGYAA